MTDTEKAEYDNIVRLLTEKLRETVDENDHLRAELARQTEGASAYDTLSEIHRNRDLPATTRAKAAIGCLPHEMPKLTPVPPAIDATCEEVVPLAEKVHQQRARMDHMHREARNIQVLPSGQVLLLDGNGSDDSSD